MRLVFLISFFELFVNVNFTDGQIKINFTDSISGDFSFKENWSYPEGVYVDAFGQVCCDGFCPDEIQKMKDKTGKIRSKYLEKYYELVDTTHLFHTIECETNCFEYTNTSYINARRITKDSIDCNTECNASTHSSLHLTLNKDICYATIQLISIWPGGNATFLCKDGCITIDRNLWNLGILKAKFDFTFENKDNADEPFFWKGKIYTKIKVTQ